MERLKRAPGGSSRIASETAAIAKKAPPAELPQLAPATLPAKPFAGTPRPPANAVQLPALGRPKAETFDGVWHQLGEVFRASPSSSLEAAIGQLGALGFSLSSAKDGRAKLTRGAFTLRIEEETLGAHRGLRLELSGPSKRGDSVERSGVEIHGTVVPEKLFEQLEERFDQVMKDFREALEDHGKKALPTTFDGLKTFIESGKSNKARAKEEAQDVEVAAALGALQDKLQTLQKQGLAPKGVVVYTDGPDGAGKSSTGAIVLGALSATGYTTGAVVFKAPTEAERKQHWLKRFEDRGVPRGENEALFWDRGPAGDTVYGPRSPAEVKQMAKEMVALKRQLAKDGILLFDVHIFADQEKQAATFGKRLARQHAADLIEGELTKRGKLTDITRDALENIRQKIDGDDLRALVSFDQVQEKFTRFSKLTGMTMIDATKRHAARLEVIAALSAQLDAFAAQSAKNS